MSGFRGSGLGLEVTESGLALPLYDYGLNTTPGTDTQTYVLRRGGAGGTIVATVTLVFTSAAQSELLSFTKTVP